MSDTIHYSEAQYGERIRPVCGGSGGGVSYVSSVTCRDCIRWVQRLCGSADENYTEGVEDSLEVLRDEVNRLKKENHLLREKLGKEIEDVHGCKKPAKPWKEVCKIVSLLDTHPFEIDFSFRDLVDEDPEEEVYGVVQYQPVETNYSRRTGSQFIRGTKRIPNVVYRTDDFAVQIQFMHNLVKQVFADLCDDRFGFWWTYANGDKEFVRPYKKKDAK